MIEMYSVSLPQGRGRGTAKRWMRMHYQVKHSLEKSMYPHNKWLRSNSQILRKTMTPEEKHLWYDFLKRLPVVAKRQFVIDNFILDFFVPSAKIAIELDGSQHFEPEAKEADKMRDAQLGEYGIKVLRYTNIDIKKNFEAVASDILKNIGLDFEDLKFDRGATFKNQV